MLGAIGTTGAYRIYPTLDHPEFVWRRWPVACRRSAGPVPTGCDAPSGSRVGRGTAVAPAARGGTGRLLVSRVLEDVAEDYRSDRPARPSWSPAARSLLRVHAPGGRPRGPAIGDRRRPAGRLPRRGCWPTCRGSCRTSRSSSPGAPRPAARGRRPAGPLSRQRAARLWPAAERRWEAAERARRAAVRSGWSGRPSVVGWADQWAGAAHVNPARVQALGRRGWRCSTTACRRRDMPRRPVARQRAGRRTGGHGHRLGQCLGRRRELDLLLLHAPCGPWPAPTACVSAALMDSSRHPRPLAGAQLARGRLGRPRPRAPPGHRAFAAVVLYLPAPCTTSAGPTWRRHLAAVARGPRRQSPPTPRRPPGPDVETGQHRPRRHSGWRPRRRGRGVADGGFTLAAMLAPSSRPGRARHAGGQRVGDRHQPRDGERVGLLARGRTSGGPRRRHGRRRDRWAARRPPLGLCTPGSRPPLNAQDGGCRDPQPDRPTCLAVAAVTNRAAAAAPGLPAGSSPGTVSGRGRVVAVALASRGAARWRSWSAGGGAGGPDHAAGLGRPPTVAKPGWNLEDARVRSRTAVLTPVPTCSSSCSSTSTTSRRLLGPRRGASRAVLAGAFRLAFMPYLMIVVAVTTGAAFPYLLPPARRDPRARRGDGDDRDPDPGRRSISASGLFADDLVLLGDRVVTWRPGRHAWLALTPCS